MNKRIIVISAVLGAVGIGLLVTAQGTPISDGGAVIVPPGVVLDFAIGPLTENDVYIPKYPGEIPYKVLVHVRHDGLGIRFRESIHIYPGQTIDRRKDLQGGHELLWTVALSDDAARADASFQLRHPDQIVLSQSIAVHLPPHGG